MHKHLSEYSLKFGRCRFKIWSPYHPYSEIYLKDVNGTLEKLAILPVVLMYIKLIATEGSFLICIFIRNKKFDLRSFIAK